MTLYRSIRVTIIATALVIYSGCAHQPETLYTQIGGQPAIDQIADSFIHEIEFNEDVIAYFKGVDIKAFRQHFTSHLCMTLDGPCEFKGKNIKEAHAGMGINTADFNTTVDLLVNAMTSTGISHRLQNKVLARLAPMRKDIIEPDGN